MIENDDVFDIVRRGTWTTSKQALKRNKERETSRKRRMMGWGAFMGNDRLLQLRAAGDMG